MLNRRSDWSWDSIPIGVTSWNCQHLFSHYIFTNTHFTKHISTTRILHFLFQNHFHIGLLPSLRRRPWNPFPSKTPTHKRLLAIGEHFCAFTHHTNISFSLPSCPFFWHYLKGKKSFLSHIHCITWGIVLRGNGGEALFTNNHFGVVAGEGKCQIKEVIFEQRR